MTKQGRSFLAVIAVAASVFTVGALIQTDARPSPAAANTGTGPAAALARAEATIATNPDDANAHALIALSSLDMVGEEADSSWYIRAEHAAHRALQIDPNNVPALDALATLANARHRFRDALRPAATSLRLAPDRFGPLEMLTDANIELGNYRAAFRLADRRLQLRPDLASYSRASYAAELRGERELALELMQLAADAARPGSDDRAWARAHVALLQLGSGDVKAARSEVQAALHESPGDSGLLAMQARVQAASGDLDASAASYQRALDSAPTAPVAAELAHVLHARGDHPAAREALALSHTLDRREVANGVVLDLDAAVTNADFRRPGAADVAMARRGHRQRSGVVGDDALGWVLTRAGRCDEGLRYARRSLRLGTQDALMFFHAGMAARCAGDRAAAQRYLRAAVDLNPRFSVRWSPVARRILRQTSR